MCNSRNSTYALYKLLYLCVSVKEYIHMMMEESMRSCGGRGGFVPEISLFSRLSQVFIATITTATNRKAL